MIRKQVLFLAPIYNNFDFNDIPKTYGCIYQIKKSNLYYTRLIPFRVSGVSDAHLRSFAPGPTHQGCSVASCWQHVGDLIGSGYEPHTSRTEADVHVLRCMLIITVVFISVKSGNQYF